VVMLLPAGPYDRSLRNRTSSWLTQMVSRRKTCSRRARTTSRLERQVLRAKLWLHWCTNFPCLQVGPRFANQNSFEHDYGTRWKQLFELRKQKADALEREMRMEEEKLEAQMEYARYEHETEMLRERESSK
jgi:hypothetical protein